MRNPNTSMPIGGPSFIATTAPQAPVAAPAPPSPQSYGGPWRTGGVGAPPQGRAHGGNPNRNGDYQRFVDYLSKATRQQPARQRTLHNGRVVGNPGGYMTGLGQANSFFSGTPWGVADPMRPKPATFGNGEMDQWRADYKTWLTNANNQFQAYQQANPNWLHDVYNWWSQKQGGAGQADPAALQQAYSRSLEKSSRWLPIQAPTPQPVAQSAPQPTPTPAPQPPAPPVQQVWEQSSQPNASRRAVWGLR